MIAQNFLQPDISLYMNKVATAIAHQVAEPPIVTYECQVMGISALSTNTFQVDLQSPPGTILDYRAGQHLKLELDVNNDGQLQSLFYSIANGFNPEQPRYLQLLIQNGGEMADKILKRLSQLGKNNVDVKVTLPMGQAFLQTNLSLPHVLIAAGSGISQVKCLTEEILRRQSDADVSIYWSNRNIDDFYLFDEFQVWLDKNKNLSFTPILEAGDANWSGRSGYLYEVIEKDFESLDGGQVYICGSPQMVYGTIDKLKATGLKEENCYSDAFEYAPRN